MSTKFDPFNWVCDVQYSIECKSSGSSGSSGSTTTTTSSPPPQVLEAYQQALGMAGNAASQPLQQYSGQVVAGFTPDQTSAFNTIDQSQGVANPYINSAQGMLDQSTSPIWGNVQQFSPSTVSEYTNPYTQNVVNASEAQMQNMDAQQQSALQGQAISSGAFGGDRAGVASAVLSGQQALANNQTVAGLESQGYGQALSEFNTQQQSQLGAQEAQQYLQAQGAYGEAGLGAQAQNSALTGASAQLQSGALQQQLNQENLNVPYEQFQQQQAYPFQTAQYYANIAEGLGSGEGGSSSTTVPDASTASQAAGLGIGGLGLIGGATSGSGSGSGLLARGGGISYRSGGNVRSLATGGPSVSGDIATGVPDVSLSFVPTPGGSSGGGGHGNSIPSPPKGEGNPNSTPSASSLLSAGKGLGSIGNSLFGGSSATSDPSTFGTSLNGSMADNQVGVDQNFVNGEGSDGGVDFASAGSTGTDSGGFLGSSADAGFGSFGSSAGEEGASSAGEAGASDAAESGIFDNMFDWFKKGGAVHRKHLADGGSSDPMTFLGMGSGSGNGASQANTDHDNKWLSQGGDIIGTVLGSVFGGPAGGYVGGKAGADAGGTMGDLFGGNWKSLGSDIKAGPIGEDPMFSSIVGTNDSAAGEGNSPQLGGNFSGTTPFNAYGDGKTTQGSPFKRGGFTMPRHYDDGGQVGGVAPTTASSGVQNQQQLTSNSSYSNMTPEQLQQVITRLPPGSSQYKSASQVLQQKRIMPNVGTQAVGGFNSQTSLPMATQGSMKRGGLCYDDGGATPSDYDLNEISQGDQPTNNQNSGQPQLAKADPWTALATAGFGMAAGNSPHAMQNIGAGALAGMKNYSEQQKEADAVNKANADNERQRQQNANTAAYQKGELGISQQNADSRADELHMMAQKYAKESAQDPGANDWSIMKDGNGNLVRVNATTGAYQPMGAGNGAQGSLTGSDPTGGSGLSIMGTTKASAKLDDARLAALDKQSQDTKLPLADQSTATLTSILQRYPDINKYTGMASEANKYLPGDWSSSSVMAPSDYQQAEGSIGALKAIAMGNTKNVRNLREFNAITAPANIFGGDGVSAQSQVNGLGALAKQAEAYRQYMHTYKEQYGTLNGADEVWQQYLKDNDPVIRDQKGNITSINEDAVSPRTWGQYVVHAPEVYSRVMNGGQQSSQKITDQSQSSGSGNVPPPPSQSELRQRMQQPDQQYQGMPKGATVIPTDAIQALRRNPNLAGDFQKKYGVPANMYLEEEPEEPMAKP